MVIALLLSGAFAGLAGAIQVYGLNYRMITDGSATGFTGKAGFNGIVAALFGQLHPIGAIPASFLFGALLVGANKLQRMMQVPAAFIIVLNGLVVVFVVSSEIWRRRRQRRRMTAAIIAAPKLAAPKLAAPEQEQARPAASPAPESEVTR
jgi:simple sugar transport system permease protein